jgi:uncharacterized protein YjbI with pentapeptide repeats
MGPGADLAGVNVVGGDLACTDLTGAQLDGVAARGLTVSRNEFTGSWSGCTGGVTLPAGWKLGNGFLIGPKANLSGIDVNTLDLSGTNLTGASSGNVTGTPSSLPTGWRLVNGYFVGAGANLSDANLANQNLAGIDLMGANLTRANLTGSDLTNANLSSANLTNSLLPGATIAGVNFDGATLTGARGFSLKGKPAAMPSQWAVFRGAFLGPGASLAGLDLRGRSLAGWNLTDVDLSNTKLGGVNLTGANLSGARLIGADLTSAKLTGAAIDGADFGGATLTGVRSGSLTTTRGTGASATTVAPNLPARWALAGGYLAGPKANLQNANLAGTNLAGVDLTGALLTGATTGPFTDGQTPATLPSGWILANGSIVGSSAVWLDRAYWLIGPRAKVGAANLYGTDLTGADLTGVDLSAATLDRVASASIKGKPRALPSGWKLVVGRLLGRGVRIPSEVSPAGVNLNNLDLSDVTASGVDFTRANLSGTKLSGAWLGAATFTRANLTGASLRGTQMGAANLTRANLTNADVRNATFTGATITGATVTGVDLSVTYSPGGLYDITSGSLTGTPTAVPSPFKLIRGYLVGPTAKLRAANLTGSDLSNMDLTSADLSGAVLTRAKLTGATISSARLADSSSSPPLAATLRKVVSGGVKLTADCLPNRICLSTVPMPSGWALIGGYLIGPGANLAGANAPYH